MSVILLAGALLFVRSLQKLLSVDPGFRPEGIVAVSVDYRAAAYPKDRIAAVRLKTLERLREQTGAISAGQVDMTPVSGSGWDQNVWADGTSDPRVDGLFNRAGPGYFRTMGTSSSRARCIRRYTALSSRAGLSRNGDPLRPAAWQSFTRSPAPAAANWKRNWQVGRASPPRSISSFRRFDDACA